MAELSQKRPTQISASSIIAFPLSPFLRLLRTHSWVSGDKSPLKLGNKGLTNKFSFTVKYVFKKLS